MVRQAMGVELLPPPTRPPLVSPYPQNLPPPNNPPPGTTNGHAQGQGLGHPALHPYTLKTPGSQPSGK